MKRFIQITYISAFIFNSAALFCQANNYSWQRATSRAPFLERDGAGIVAFNSKMWLLGGWNPVEFKPNGVTNEIWSSADGYNWSFEGNAPWSARHLHGRVVFNNKMWVISGDNNDGTYKNDVWNSSDGVNWVKVLDEAPWGNRVCPYVIVFNNKIWLMGGQQVQPQGDTVYNDIWNTEDGVNWQKVVAHAPWAPRAMIHGSAILNNKIWIYGGGDYNEPQKYYNDVWSSSDGITWDSINASPPWQSRIFINIASYDNKLWVLDGKSDQGDLNDVWYSSDGANWSELPGTPWPIRHAASVVVFDSSLWMMAGRLKNGVWRLKSNTLVITSPFGGTLKADTTIDITWKSSINNTVSLDYSTNGGNTWINITSHIPASQGDYLWNTARLAPSIIKVRIKSDFDPSLFDIVTYKFEEVNLQQGVSSFYPLNTNVLDASSNGYNGTAYNILPYADRFGNDSGATAFNGATSLAILPAQSYTPFTSDFTISFWEKSYSSIVTAPLSIGADPNNFDIYFNSGGIGMWPFWNSGGANGMRIDYTSQYTKDQWTHVLITRKDDRVLVFIDGGYVLQTVYSNPIARADNIILGQSSTSTAKWNGALDELRIFNRSLNDQEISSIYKFTNHKPHLLTDPDTLLKVDSAFFYKIIVVDQDTAEFGDRPTLQYLHGPSWINYDSTNNTISGIPQNKNYGDTVIVFRLRDLFGSDIQKSIPLHISYTNHTPVIVSHPDTLTVEDQVYRYRMYASDQDSLLFGDRVHYRLINRPSWLSIDSVSGVISGIARVQNLPDTIVTGEAYDEKGGVTRQRYRLHIAHVNHVPEIISIGKFTIQEDTLYQYQVIVEDPDTLIGDVLSYSLTKKPSWLSVNSTGLITGIPLGKNVGDTVVTVRVSDGKGGIASQSYALTITHTNHAPQFISSADTTAVEDSLYIYTARASDQDSVLFGDIVRYRLSVKPSWLRIDSMSGMITGTPEGMQARDTVVDIQAFDNKGGIGQQRFTLHVQHVNHPPEITSLPDTVAYEDSLYTYHILAADQDVSFGKDTLTYSIEGNPTWITIDSNKGIVHGIPKVWNGTDTTYTVKVKDRGGLTVTQTVNLRIIYPNHPPVFHTTPITLVKEDSLYRYQAYADDIDSLRLSDRVRYRLRGKSSWLSVDSMNGLVSGVPRSIDVGVDTVQLQTYDRYGGSTLQNYLLSVIHTNHAPIMVNRLDTTAREGIFYNLRVYASDQDSLLFGDILRYHLIVKPYWLSIDSSSGQITGMPYGRDVGDTVITVQVNDGKGGIATVSYMLTILHTNHTPVILSHPDTLTVEDQAYRYRMYASDQDSLLFGDRVHYRLVNRPSWLSIDSVSGVISGIAKVQNLPDTIVTGEAYDGKGGVTQQRYRLHIAHVNHVPEIVSIGKFSIQEDTLYRYQVIVEDPDTLIGDVLSYSLTKKPSWLSVNSTGLITGIPLGKNVGDTVVTVRVSDGKGGIASQSYALTITHTNHAPQFISEADTTTVEDSLYVYTARAADQDSVLFGDIIRYRLSVKPSWLQIDSVSGMITGKPSGVQARDTVVDIQAFDNKGGIGQQRFTLHVQHVNHPPEISSLPDTVAYEDSLYTYHIKVFDPDVVFFGDSLRIKKIILPVWLKMNGDSIVAGIPGWLNVGDTLAVFEISDGRGGEILQNWKIHVYHINHIPIAGDLISPRPEDTVTLKDPPIPINFVWNRAKDKDIVDTLTYTITIQGSGLDTTIAGIKDTMVSMTFMKRLKPSAWYRWWIDVSDGDVIVASKDTNKFKTSNRVTYVSTLGSEIPKIYALAQNYPNPFNPATKIQYDLPKESQIRLTVYNLLGQLVGVIFDGIQHAGRYEIDWKPASASSGIYFLIMEAKDQIENQTHFRAVVRMLLLR